MTSKAISESSSFTRSLAGSRSTGRTSTALNSGTSIQTGYVLIRSSIAAVISDFGVEGDGAAMIIGVSSSTGMGLHAATAIAMHAYRMSAMGLRMNRGSD